MKGNRLIPLLRRGDGSTLSLDFTSMSSLDSRLTFTRASTTSTFINSSGLVATAGTNVARFDYNPTTLAPRGLLIEGSATNLLNWSESFATTGGTNNNWADTNITRNSTNNTDPANGTTALRVTAASANGTIISTAAIGTSAQRTFSIWLRRVSGTGDIQYTLDNGSTYTTQAITSSWVRYTFASTTAAQRVGIRIVTSGDSIELWGAQLEAGSGASSYIPTGASTVQRAADSIEITGTNFSSWWPNPTTEFSVQWIGDITRSPNTTQFLWLARAGGLSKARGYVTTGAVIRGNSSVTDFLMSPATNAVANTVIKMAMAVKSGDSAMYVNDGTVIGSQTDATTGTTTNHDSIYLNPNGDNFTHIRSFKFWRSRLPNATLQTLVQ